MSTANPQRGEVEITLDKPRIMSLRFKAIAQAEGIGKFNIFQLKLQDMGMNEFRALGYAGLHKHDPRLTLDAFDELIDSEERLSALMSAVKKALELSFGKAEADEDVNPLTPASPSTGQST